MQPLQMYYVPYCVGKHDQISMQSKFQNHYMHTSLMVLCKALFTEIWLLSCLIFPFCVILTLTCSSGKFQ